MSFGIQYYGKGHHMPGERYVYYQRLGEFPEHAALRGEADSVMNYRIEEGSNLIKISDYFIGLSNGELAKEKKLLISKFGTHILGEYDTNTNLAKELIEAFNTIFSTKEIFERNYKLITQTQGQKGLFTWFPTYFDRVWKVNQDIIVQDFENAIDLSDNLIERLRTAIIPHLYDMVKEALGMMMTETDAEDGLDKEDRERLRTAFAWLKDGLKTNDGNIFIQGFIDTYFGKSTFENLEKKINENKVDLKSFKLESAIGGEGGGIHIKGGNAMEHFGTFLVNMVASEIQKANISGAVIHSTHTGATQMAPDFITTIDLPTDMIQDWLEENGFGDREKNTASAYKLEEGLKGFKDGFIVYSNAKNYSLNENFTDRGFSAGTKISMDTWDNMTKSLHMQGRDLIFAAMQLIPGAIGQGKDEEVKSMFARAIAAALFNDFNVIGEVKRESANSIHLLYLNGVYMPLSFYFNLLADAFREVGSYSTKQLVNVTISKPKSIIFNFDSGPEGWNEGISKWKESNPGISPWHYQQQDALNAIKIEYHFLRGIQKIFQDLNIQF